MLAHSEVEQCHERTELGISCVHLTVVFGLQSPLCADNNKAWLLQTGFPGPLLLYYYKQAFLVHYCFIIRNRLSWSTVALLLETGFPGPLSLYY